MRQTEASGWVLFATSPGGGTLTKHYRVTWDEAGLFISSNVTLANVMWAVNKFDLNQIVSAIAEDIERCAGLIACCFS